MTSLTDNNPPDNNPPQEPHAVRAHLHGGIPVAEIDQQPLVLARCVADILAQVKERVGEPFWDVDRMRTGIGSLAYLCICRQSAAKQVQNEH